MRQLVAGLGVAVALASNVVQAQVVVDPFARTLRLDYTSSYGADVNFSDVLKGTISTSDLASAAGGGPVHLVFQVALNGSPAWPTFTPFTVSASGDHIRDAWGVPVGMYGGMLVTDSTGAVFSGLGTPSRFAETYFDAGQSPGADPFSYFDLGYPDVYTTPGTTVGYALSLSGYIGLDSYGPGAVGHMNGSITLTGVNAYDSAGKLIGTASFYGNGNGTFGTAPEPSSLALLGTGLVSLVPMVRRKRRA